MFFRSTSSPSSLPMKSGGLPSRPSTRQSARHREARLLSYTLLSSKPKRRSFPVQGADEADGSQGRFGLGGALPGRNHLENLRISIFEPKSLMKHQSLKGEIKLCSFRPCCSLSFCLEFGKSHHLGSIHGNPASKLVGTWHPKWKWWACDGHVSLR